MKLLIIGGTVFVGRHLVEAALERGHEVTLFNRGQHNPELFPTVEKLRGDRDGDMSALEGREWDAVIDTCGYLPRVVSYSAQLLADAVGHYTFISSISAYADFSRPHTDESAPVGSLDDEAVEQITNETYGPLKALCEQSVERSLPGRSLIVRPGLIVGPFDLSDRFTYWPARVSRGGDALVPGSPGQRVEIIDVRDLAGWTVRMIESGATGLYNATGPDYPLTMQTVLDVCKAVSGSDARFTYVSGEFLKGQEVEPNAIHTWYVPEEETAFQYVFDIDCSRAIAAGLTYRALVDTVRDTLVWHQTRPADHKLRIGIEPEREAELLRRWREAPQESGAEEA